MSSTTVVPEQVVVGPANDEQRDTVRAAMSRPLTTVGTRGKNALIVNLVATAVAAEQRVLVVSPDEAAVDEVWQRCEQAVSGLMARPGGRVVDADGGAQVSVELGVQGAAPHAVAVTETQPLSSARAAYIDAARRANSLREAVRAKAAMKAKAQAARAQRAQALETIEKGAEPNGTVSGATSGAASRAATGATTAAVTAAHSPATYRLRAATDQDLARLRQRSSKLSQPRRWSDGPRRRFLERLGIMATAESAVTLCLAVGAFAEAEISWRALRPKAAPPSRPTGPAGTGATTPPPTDADLATSLAAAEEQERLRGAELIKAKLHTLKAGETPAMAITCSSAKAFSPDNTTFDLVIIDEANQCSVPTALSLAKRAVLIGEPPHDARMAVPIKR